MEPVGIAPSRLPGSFKASTGDRPERFPPLSGRRPTLALNSRSTTFQGPGPFRPPRNAGSGRVVAAIEIQSAKCCKRYSAS
jgi:hypothetical protein